MSWLINTDTASANLRTGLNLFRYSDGFMFSIRLWRWHLLRVEKGTSPFYINALSQKGRPWTIACGPIWISFGNPQRNDDRTNGRPE